MNKPITMDDKYGDGLTECVCCPECGYCITCGDCKKHGCQEFGKLEDQTFLGLPVIEVDSKDVPDISKIKFGGPLI